MLLFTESLAPPTQFRAERFGLKVVTTTLYFTVKEEHGKDKL
jgi:hypothetical protein